ncbi:DUF3618 domain-containing protein [Streptomyces sp. NPDC091273]|uniref:DUF3618 domain-containing protein n=1 Tax=Streptomyces sp. NPDC091273 TaxID=3365982 RepID=UPI0038264084
MNDDARTNIGTPAPTPGGPGSAELRDQVERTRDELGQTVEALAAKADIKAQAKEKKAAVVGQAAEKAALVSEQIREKTGYAVQLMKAKTPDPLLEKAGQAATAARANRTPLLVAGAVLVVFLLVRRGRGRRR